jgi:hypothetical protein
MAGSSRSNVQIGFGVGAGKFSPPRRVFSPVSGVIEYNIPNPKGLRHYHLVEPRSAAVMSPIA